MAEKSKSRSKLEPKIKSIQEIKKEWVFHFIVFPATSRIDKPEWYLNKTLKWIYMYIDSAPDKKSANSQEDKVVAKGEDKQVMRRELITTMLDLVKTRLSQDVKKMLDEPLLIHTYNEVMDFVRVIRQLLGDHYDELEEQHDVLSVFSSQHLFEQISKVEWDYAQKNINEIINSSGKWVPVLDGDYEDPYKIPKCVDRFLMLASSVSGRVELWRQEDCQAALIELLCNLFNTFYNFLEEAADTCVSEKAINGINFLQLTLKEQCFLPKNSDLDRTLLEKWNKMAKKYRALYYSLVEETSDVR